MGSSNSARITKSMVKSFSSSTMKEIFEKQLPYLDELRAQRKTTNLAVANRNCNRYSDILPFDENVVRLENGYINASYMTSLFGNSKYIAAQGPLPTTVEQFWEMVWQENSYLIIMLTPEKEGSRIKCHDYWRMGQYGKFGIAIESESSIQVSDTTMRKIKLSRAGQERIITQVHFTGWPDHQRSSPEQLIDLIFYCNIIAKELPMSIPIVHCSAGGTFCAIDGIIKDLQADLQYGQFYIGSLASQEEMDILPQDDLIAMTVNHLRNQRVYSVQSFAQFALIYQCLNLLKEKLLSQ